MSSLWPQRRNPLEDRILRRRRQPASSAPGFGLCNLLIDDTNQDVLLIDDAAPDVLRIDGGAFAEQPVLPVTGMSELVSPGTPENVGGNFRYAWAFRPDGLRAHTWRTNPSATFSFRQYDVSPAWSLQNADWSSSGTPVLIGGSLARDFVWNNDGTKLITSQRWFSSFYRLISYDQSATPYDASILGAATVYTNVPPGLFTIRFNADGTELTLEHQAGQMQTRSLAVAFDISTIVTTPIAVFDSRVDAGSRSTASFAFSSDGTLLYSMTTAGLLCQWTLSTPYDISTAGSFVTGITVHGPGGTTNMGVPRGMFVRPATGHIYLQKDQGSPQRVKVFG